MQCASFWATSWNVAHNGAGLQLKMFIENASVSLLKELEQDRSLDEPRHLRRRIEALDELDAYVQAGQPIETALHRRARAICADLESVNSKLYEAIRRDIQRGKGAGRLLEWIPDGPAEGFNGNGAAKSHKSQRVCHIDGFHLHQRSLHGDRT